MDSILVVDKSVQNTDLVSQILRAAGYETYTSESGLNALAKIELFKPGLVILEVDLPDISGYDVCKKIKENPETQYILVLVVSLKDTNDLRMRSIQAGADDFIEKTFDAPIIIAKVKALLRLKHLSDQLKQKYTELEEKNNILDFQLKMGRQVQRSLMPEINFNHHDVSFTGRYMPAMDIGGDFYDVVHMNDGYISVVIGDVCGHGIAAALLTAMLNMMTRNLMLKYPGPEQVLFHMNNEFYDIFCNSDHEMYASVFYAVFDTAQRKIYYSNAGASLPVFVDANKKAAFELECSGLPIGLIKGSQYEYKTLEYSAGDMLFFHTDGLMDIFYKNNPDEFARSLNELLLDALAFESPQEIIDTVLRAYYDYNASSTKKYELDDVSVILCRM